MTGKNKNLLKLLAAKGIYFLPFLIASFNIFLFANIDRYSYAASAPDDQGLFQRIASNILENGNFSGSTGPDKVFCVTRPPLYPSVLALTWGVTKTRSLVFVRGIQIISYFLSLLFIFRISTVLTEGDNRYGFMSFLFASLIPHTAALTHVVLTESLAIFFLSLSVLLAVMLRRKMKPMYLILLGCSLGLLNLQRPNFLLIPVIFIAYVFFFCQKEKRSFISSVLLIIFPFIAIISPWCIFNKMKIDAYSLAYTTAGYTLMFGIIENSPALKKNTLDDVNQISANNFNRKPYYDEIDRLLHSPVEISMPSGHITPEISRLIALSMLTYIEAWRTNPAPTEKVIMSDTFLKKTALVWIEKNPYKFFRVVLKNCKNMLFGNDQPLVYQQLTGPIYISVFTLKILLYLFFLAAIFVVLRAGHFDLAFFPIIIIAYIIIINSLMHTEPRYFVYAYLFMAVVIPSVVKRDRVGKKISRSYSSTQNE